MSSLISAPNYLLKSDRSLAASTTKGASKQTYYTVRFFADRNLVSDAYRAYGYFRWVDDQLDQGGMGRSERLAFIKSQRALIDGCYRGEWPEHVTDEESMLVDLVRSDRLKNSGLQSYIRNMMAVMAFDAERRGRLITQDELARYTRSLAIAVTDALHYFIGHRCKLPECKFRYSAATAAHIAHMLRDTLEDTEAGYYNIPGEYVKSHGIDVCDVLGDPYRKWVQSRVQQARAYLDDGKSYLALVNNPRCRVAGYAYVSRFYSVLDAIEKDGCRLRSEYPECKSFATGIRLGWSVILLSFSHRRKGDMIQVLPAR